MVMPSVRGIPPVHNMYICRRLRRFDVGFVVGAAIVPAFVIRLMLDEYDTCNSYLQAKYSQARIRER